MRRFLIILGMVSLVILFAQNLFAQEEVRIGVYYPMTGPASVYGQIGWKGLQLAHKERPTVLGKPVKLILVDNKSDKVESANAVSRLIEKENVTAIIGGLTSSNTLSGAPIAEKARVPMISPWATNPLVTQNRKYIFRACFIDPFQGLVGAKFAREVLKAKTAAVMVDIAQDYVIGIANFFTKNFEKLGGKVIMKTFYQTGDQDFTAQLTAIAQAKPDLIYNPGYFAEDALIARQARELGINIPFMSGDAAQADELIKIGGEAVEGLYFTTHFEEKGVTTESGKRFVKLFRDAYNQTPDSVSALSWDAYNMLLDAIERAGSLDKDRIRDELENTKDFQGATGVITIENGDGIKPAVILKVENGKFVYVATVQPM
ncbi:MAG: ABC transporter substrate-binding protein [Nitrospinota bacterium]|nr:MAG: ABC transporter substrate-binding protein [Nitrospinota bacterium]